LLSESQFIAAEPSGTATTASEGDTGDLAGSSRTLTTLAVSPPQPALPRWILPSWAWTGLAAITVATVAALVRLEGASRSEVAETPAPVPPSVAQAAPELPLAQAPAEASRYVVSTTFEPPDAAISLDGQPLQGGAVDATFPKDGRAHELRAVAPGYAPALVVFVDAPPPGVIRLEALPTVPPTAPVDSTANTAPVDGRANTVPVQAEVVVLKAKARRPHARRPSRPPQPGRATTATPSIQTIRAGTPTIRVIP
jgi:hypothetical protein